MPWGVAAAGVAAAGSIGAASIASGGSGGSGWTPGGNFLDNANQDWVNLLKSQIGDYNQGNPYGAGYQQAANQAGQGYGNLASMAGQQGNQLNSLAQNSFGSAGYLQGVGQQVYNTALDPQNALYNRTVQQLQDQTGATNSMYGLGSSAAGAGVANQALGNFNIDWQNNQISRQLQGLQGLNSAYGTAGQYSQLGDSQLNQSQQLGALGPQYQLAAGQTPYSSWNDIVNSQISQASGIQGQIIPYLNGGTNATQFNAAATQQNNANLGSSIASSVGNLGSAAQNYFQNTGSSYYPSSATNAFGGNSASQMPSYNYGSYGGGGLGSPAQSYYPAANQYGFTM